MNKTFKSCLTKKEVAQLYGISMVTLSNWLNDRYYEELLEMGYYKNQKILNPKILNFLQEITGLQPPD